MLLVFTKTFRIVLKINTMLLLPNSFQHTALSLFEYIAPQSLEGSHIRRSRYFTPFLAKQSITAFLTFYCIYIKCKGHDLQQMKILS